MRFEQSKVCSLGCRLRQKGSLCCSFNLILRHLTLPELYLLQVELPNSFDFSTRKESCFRYKSDPY